MFKRELNNFSEKEIPYLLSMLALEYQSNNMGVAKTTKWLAKSLDVFEDEISSQLNAHGDLGEGMYHFDISKQNNNFDMKPSQLLELLSQSFEGIDTESFSLFKRTVLDLSSLELKWYLRYALQTPRNGINKGLVQKIMASFYDKKISDIKRDCNFNTIYNVCLYYSMNEQPPLVLHHGSFVAPMLAKEVPPSQFPLNKILDFKYDGNRYQVHIENKKIIIFNRKGKIVTNQFEDVVEMVIESGIPNGIYDGEIYPIDANGYPTEHKNMATRVHSKNKKEAMEKVKVCFVIFDCLKIGNEVCMNLPYEQRIQKMVDNDVSFQAERQIGGDFLSFYHRAINEGFEGIIVKDANAPYEAGKRSKYWCKYKPPQIELDVVILSAFYGEGKRKHVFGSFEIGVKCETGFYSLGQIGSGFSLEDLIYLTNTLRKNVENFKDGIYSVFPRVVLEVKADLITKDLNDKYSLRFPRMKRIRHDKFVQDINTLEDVERKYNE